MLHLGQDAQADYVIVSSLGSNQVNSRMFIEQPMNVNKEITENVSIWGSRDP